MQYNFPEFLHHREDGEIVWRGKLCPTEVSPDYEVEIRWRPRCDPRVFVVSPPLKPGAPHTYDDGSLCLQFPGDRSWTDPRFVATHVVPWTAEYLNWYEIWLETRKWYGPEKSHHGVKSRD